MAIFVKPKARDRRIGRHQQKLGPLATQLAAVMPRVPMPPDTPRNRKLLAKKANYQGRGAPGTKIVKEFYDQNTGTSVLRAV